MTFETNSLKSIIQIHKGCEKSGSEIKCLNTAGSTQKCYVPNCERYTRKYPGSPGLSYTWKQNYGSLNRWYYLINHFGVETNFGTPATEGTDILSNTYYGKGQGFIRYESMNPTFR